MALIGLAVIIVYYNSTSSVTNWIALFEGIKYRLYHEKEGNMGFKSLREPMV